jgi:hypothetical protein
VSGRLSALLLLNALLLLLISQRYVVLRDAWRSHNMARSAWEVLERDQLGRGQEIFGEGFILPTPGLPHRPDPTNSRGP